MLLVDSLADEVSTPKQSEKPLPIEPKCESSRSVAETRSRTSAPDPCHRPSKVEKILWMGRDSLNLFSGTGNGLKRHDSDRRNDHTECGDIDAVQGNAIVWRELRYLLNGATADRQMRQLSVTPTQTDSRPLPTATLVRPPVPVMAGHSHPIATVVIQVLPTPNSTH